MTAMWHFDLLEHPNLLAHCKYFFTLFICYDIQNTLCILYMFRVRGGTKFVRDKNILHFVHAIFCVISKDESISKVCDLHVQHYTFNHSEMRSIFFIIIRNSLSLSLSPSFFRFFLTSFLSYFLSFFLVLSCLFLLSSSFLPKSRFHVMCTVPEKGRLALPHLIFGAPRVHLCRLPWENQTRGR